MHGLTDAHLLHSFVLMFFCLIIVASCLFSDSDPWSGPGMTVLVNIIFSGCTLFKDRRTEEQKSSLNAIMCVQASLTNIRSFNVVHLWCYVYDLLLKDKNRSAKRVLQGKT